MTELEKDVERDIVALDVAAELLEVDDSLAPSIPSDIRKASATLTALDENRKALLSQVDVMREALEKIERHYTDTDLAAKHMAAIARHTLSTLPTVGEVPDYCYDPDNWETTIPWSLCGELVDDFDDRMERGPFEVACLKQLPNKYVADVPTEIDDDGDVLDSEWRWFDTLEEAKAALAPTPMKSEGEGA